MVAVTFLHLDLGVGGAERLIVDAAVALKKHKHDVRIVTTHHDKEHCFEETKNGTIPVTVVGDWLPRNVCGRCGALFSYIRMIYAALYMVFFSGVKSDLTICDQVSACVPILQLGFHRVVFYCHFPDLLLSKRGGFLKRLYRMPLNYVEEKTTGMANVVLVNSEFTKNTFKSTFKSLTLVPDVLYPSINDRYLEGVYSRCDDVFRSSSKDFDPDRYVYFLSVNRYERKKNVELAVEAFTRLLWKLEPEQKIKLRLVLAGGYDTNNKENYQYYKELMNRITDLKVTSKVVLFKTPCVDEKIKLMKACRALLYTPDNEHFGIVPLEAMFCRKPVIAVNSGGPTETVVHRETGLLCSPTSGAFSDAMLELYKDDELCTRLGEAARVRFEKYFSFDAFAEKLNSYVTEM